MPRLDDVAFCRMRPILDRRSVSMRGVRKTEREREGGREGGREREGGVGMSWPLSTECKKGSSDP